MKPLQCTAVLSLILVGWAGSASADPDKDESGKGRWRGGYERNYDIPVEGTAMVTNAPAASVAPSNRNTTTAVASTSASLRGVANTWKR